MILPQFTIFRLLSAIAVCGVISWLAVRAVAGDVWAAALSITIGCFAIWLVLQFILVLAGYVFSSIASLFITKKTVSPFATNTPAPQIIPPDNIDKE